MWSEQVNLSAERRRASASKQGFTLLELMTVVIIVGILSAVAIPTFSNYIYKSRTSEATEFLGVIRLREESYRSEFGMYCPTIPAGSSPNLPASLNDKSLLVPDPSTTKRDAKPFVSTGPWTQLGARPSGTVRFGYGVVGGTPAEAPRGDTAWSDATADFWFIARAVGDLDADNLYCTFEIYSGSKNVWLGDQAGNPLVKGWE